MLETTTKSRSARFMTAALGLALGVGMMGGVMAQSATPTPYKAGTDLTKLSGKVTADGSSTVGPITEAVAEEFGKQATGVQVTVDISGTGGGFKRFCAGETDVQDASRDIKPEEATICKDKKVDFYKFEVAYDGVSIVVNKENTWLQCLNLEALKMLWDKDSKVTKWSDLNPEFPSDKINLYGPGTDSGTFDYFTEKINGVQGQSRTDYTPSEDDNVLVEGVSGDKNALGYFGFAYYEANQDKLRLVGVDSGAGCVEPSKDAIRDLTYKPLSRPLYVFVKADSLKKPEVQEFMRFYLASAQALVDDVGYVDSPIDVYVGDQAKLEAAIGGTGTPDSAAK